MGYSQHSRHSNFIRCRSNLPLFLDGETSPCHCLLSNHDSAMMRSHSGKQVCRAKQSAYCDTKTWKKTEALHGLLGAGCSGDSLLRRPFWSLCASRLVLIDSLWWVPEQMGTGRFKIHCPFHCHPVHSWFGLLTISPGSGSQNPPQARLKAIISAMNHRIIRIAFNSCLCYGNSLKLIRSFFCLERLGFDICHFEAPRKWKGLRGTYQQTELSTKSVAV